MKPTMWTYYLYRVVGFLVPLLPIRLGHRLAERIADIVAWLRPQERAIVKANIRQVMGSDPGDRELERMARNTYRCSFKNYFDLFWMAKRPVEQVRERVETENWNYVEQAFAMGRGVIVVSLHYGNPELALQIVPIVGKPCWAPAEHVQPEALFQYLCRLRQARGVRLLPVDGPLTEIMRALRRGEGVGLALDRDATNSGRRVEFFGKPAHLPDGFAVLALRTGAPVLLVLNWRLPRARYILRAYPPMLFPVVKQPDDATVEQTMRQVLTLVEKEMQRDPSQWVVFRRIWND